MNKTISRQWQKRMAQRHDELRWLYMELYNNDAMFAELCDGLYHFWQQRPDSLHRRDREREAKPDWYRQPELLGMMLYVDNFAGTLRGVQDKLDYLQKAGVNLLHLMPFLDTVEGESDGGYAVADFRKVRPELGTIDDLRALADCCHQCGINLCMDFVMNHTSCRHEWARRARAGDGEYMSRYFFYREEAIPRQFEQTMPQVFPTTAPGNFTWLEDCGHYVMTTFYPYQWDLNYGNPRVFNEMIYNFLFLANCGMDVIRLDAVPYIWKELGTNCRNLPQVHTLVRMLRLIAEIVCPSVLLLGEVVMEPERIVPYFGTAEKPECHLLYNVTTMATIWHTVATKDVRLLRRQLNITASLPEQCAFLNYLRCHDDIGWGLDYDTLASWGFEERAHKQFLSDYFLGRFPGSTSRGELYNADPASGDARFCGTTASMCGVQAALQQNDPAALDEALCLDELLHALMFFQAGIPMLYSGDEIAQCNDASYHTDPNRAADSRYIHRGRMNWANAEQAADIHTVQGRLFHALHRLEKLRVTLPAFAPQAKIAALGTDESNMLVLRRTIKGQSLLALFNFSREQRQLVLPVQAHSVLKESPSTNKLTLDGYGYDWLVIG